MTTPTPTDTKNLDIYGSPPIPWERALTQLQHGGSATQNNSFYLSTVDPDGRPHLAGIGSLWHDGSLYFTSGPGTRKSRNLAANPACAISGHAVDLDIVFEGTASRVTDQPTLDAIAARFREDGWPAEVSGDALVAPYSAPSAGPPPWHLYRLDYDRVYGVATAEPYGATRWSFAR
jgi:hypothetical protein